MTELRSPAGTSGASVCPSTHTRGVTNYSLLRESEVRIVARMNSPDAALEEARRAGFDLDLLDSNLALTPEQRALRHESALELMLELKEAGRVLYEKPARQGGEAG